MSSAPTGASLRVPEEIQPAERLSAALPTCPRAPKDSHVTARLRGGGAGGGGRGGGGSQVRTCSGSDPTLSRV